MLYVSFVGFTHHNSIIQYYYLYIIIYCAHIDHGGAAAVGRTGWMACLFEYIIIYGSSGSPKYFLSL